MEWRLMVFYGIHGRQSLINAVVDGILWSTWWSIGALAIFVMSGHGRHFAYNVHSMVGCSCHGQLHFIGAMFDMLRRSHG